MKNEEFKMKEEWDEVWSREGMMARLVHLGRNFYNLFFKRLLLRYVRKYDRMLELGCGTASLGFLLARNLASYHGIDISPGIVEKAQMMAVAAHIGNMTFATGDCRNLDADYRGQYDLAWSQGLIEHFDDSYQVVQNHIDSVRPGPPGQGSTVLISVPYKYSFHNVWYKLTRPRILRRFWPWTEQKFFSHQGLAELGRRSGLPYRVFLLPPVALGLFLGIIILEIKKNG